MSNIIKIKNHMVDYKINYLKISKHGRGYGRYKNNFYDHILPRQLDNLNILEPLRDEIWSNFSKLIDHSPRNLVSSQVACINFFSPLILLNDKKFLKEYFYLGQEDILEMEFEFNFNDSGGFSRSTQVDLYVKSSDNGNEINNLFEIKYSEQTFLKYINKEEVSKYEAKFYGKPYQKNGKTFNEENASNYVKYNDINKLMKKEIRFNEFIRFYQLFRNLFNCQIDKGGRFFVIIPKPHKTLLNQFNRFKELISINIKDDYQYLLDNIKLIFWEDLLQAAQEYLASINIDDNYNDHYKEFEKKYIYN